MISSRSLIDYLTHLFCRMGCPYGDANVVSEVLVEAELRGISAHGLRWVKRYYQMIAAGRIKTEPNVGIAYQTPSSATIDGDNCLGAVAAHYAMRVAIDKARTAGTGLVAVRGSNHFGIGAYYVSQALEQDMVGVAFTNAPPIVAPVYSTSRMLGANPIAMAMPALRNPPLIIDFATTAYSQEQLEEMGQRGDKISEGVVQDAVGEVTKDPTTLARGGAMVPLGGDTERGAHKGFCLTSLVDLVSSMFSGAGFGPFVPPQVPYLPGPRREEGRGVGHFFMAIRTDAFRPAKEFKLSVDAWIETFRNAKGIEGTSGVVIPGEPERVLRELHLKEGLELTQDSLRELREVAQAVGVEELHVAN